MVFATRFYRTYSLIEEKEVILKKVIGWNVKILRRIMENFEIFTFLLLNGFVKICNYRTCLWIQPSLTYADQNRKLLELSTSACQQFTPYALLIFFFTIMKADCRKLPQKYLLISEKQ